MKRLWLVVGIVVVLGIIAAGIIVLLPKPYVPASIKKQVTSTVLIPSNSDISINRSSMKHDEKLKVLSFTLTAYDTEMVVSEQPTPETFTDIPQVYEKVVSSMNEYSKFETDIGTVHLTKPKDLKGRQAAVLNTKGTLLFAKPESDLSDDNWRRFFSSFVVEK